MFHFLSGRPIITNFVRWLLFGITLVLLLRLLSELFGSKHLLILNCLAIFCLLNSTKSKNLEESPKLVLQNFGVRAHAPITS